MCIYVARGSDEPRERIAPETRVGRGGIGGRGERRRKRGGGGEGCYNANLISFFSRLYALLYLNVCLSYISISVRAIVGEARVCVFVCVWFMCLFNVFVCVCVCLCVRVDVCMSGCEGVAAESSCVRVGGGSPQPYPEGRHVCMCVCV